MSPISVSRSHNDISFDATTVDKREGGWADLRGDVLDRGKAPTSLSPRAQHAIDVLNKLLQAVLHTPVANVNDARAKRLCLDQL